MRVLLIALIAAACAPASPTAPSPSDFAAASCNAHSQGALVAAFASTAGAVAAWQEARGRPNGPYILRSQWRSHDAAEPVAVCYFDGAFPCPGGPPPLAPATPKPRYDRMLVEIAANGEVVPDICGYQSVLAPLPP